MNTSLTVEDLKGRIFRIRGQQVMLGQNLAALYGVAPRALIQAVKRNLSRFPSDFMFQLSENGFEPLKSQIVTSKASALRSQDVILKRGAHVKYRPFAFTEHGIAMLSSVLRSERAVQVNIAIMRAFIKLRHALHNSHDLARRVEKVEGKIGLIETDIRFILQDIRDIKKPLEIPPKPQPHVKGFET